LCLIKVSATKPIFAHLEPASVPAELGAPEISGFFHQMGVEADELCVDRGDRGDSGQAPHPRHRGVDPMLKGGGEPFF
jgi:hypothetical protein